MALISEDASNDASNDACEWNGIEWSLTWKNVTKLLVQDL